MNRLLTPALVLAAVLLAGCAGLRQIDSEVSSFGSPQAAPAGARYRFERLPSQQSPTQVEAQQRLEGLAAQALAKVGLQHDEAAAQYSVQIGVRVQRDPRAPWDDPWYGPWGPWGPWGWPGRDFIVTRRGQVVAAPMAPYPPWGWEAPFYRREVGLVMRALAGGQVVYETRATHGGRWPDDWTVLGAMFEAALAGYPDAPAGPRRVGVPLPR